MKFVFILVATLSFMVYNINGVIPPPGRPCPPDKPRVNCFVAPCMFARCPAFPQARCVDNYCGGCFADFYLRYRKVDCNKYSRRRRQTTCDIFCPAIFLPVCGSDGKTYGNACELRRADCLSPDRIRLVHNGPCYCLLPKVVGPCEARIPRYYYNRRTRRCELFYYGGCQGNRNNFKTKAACENTCIRRRRRRAWAGYSKPV